MITVVVPAYNEEEVIKPFIDDLESKVTFNEPWEILVVNDGSRDRTAEILAALSTKYKNLRVVHHKVNQNLGAALRTGIQAAAGDVIITMDADMTHPPHLMAKMVSALRDHDVCVASRFVGDGGMLNVPLYRVLISRFANMVYRLLFLSPINDNTTGYKAYRADVIKSVDIQETGFAVQLEIVTHLLKKQATFKEIPFTLVNRKLGASKLRYLKAIPHYLRHVLHLLSIRWL